MSRQQRRLFDLEIDEVSAVDRPANQLGRISIAKSLGPEEDGVADDQGQLTLELPDGVQHGDTVVTDDGDEFVYLEVGEDGTPLPLEGVDTAALLEQSEIVYNVGDDEPEQSEQSEQPDEPEEPPAEQVGKGALGEAFAAGRKRGLAGKKLAVPRASAKPPVSVIKVPGQQTAKQVGNVAGRSENWIRQNPLHAAGAAGTAGLGLGMGGAYMTTRKSLGTTVLEELSKAVTSEERDRIVAKMADEVEITKAENEELRQAFEEERDIRVTEAFVAKAAEYELPVEPAVFGPILKAIAEVLDDDQLDVLDAVLSSRGVALDELGYAGGATNSGVLDEVNGLAAELVTKAGGSVSTEQASTALFEHNPGAYEAYLSEQDGR